MFKFIKECFLCVCFFLVLYTKNCSYSYQTNAIHLNSVLFVTKKPLRTISFPKKKRTHISAESHNNKTYFSKQSTYCKRANINKKIRNKTCFKYTRSANERDVEDEKNKHCQPTYKENLNKDSVRKEKWDKAVPNDIVLPTQQEKGETKGEKKSRMNETLRKRLSELAKQRWQNEEERKKLLQSKKKFKHSEETKRLLSHKIKLKWKDENYRKRIIEKTRSFNQDENTKRRKSIILKEKWKIKEFREKMLRCRKPFSPERRHKISEIIKQKWRCEDYKQKTLKAIKENYKKRKLQVGLNPDLNYIQNVTLFKQLGLQPPKMRIFPDVHIRKLKEKNRKKKEEKKKNAAIYKENWKHIYDSILHKDKSNGILTYVHKIDNMSISNVVL